MFFTIVLCITFLIPTLSSINSKNYCFSTDDKCLAINGSMNFECLKTDCIMFGIKCSKNFCSKDKYSCGNMHSLLKHINSLETFKHNAPLRKTLQNLKETWSAFKAKVKNCIDVPNEWKKSGICLNGKNCRMKSKLPLRLGGIYLITPTDCKCQGKYPIMCSKNFCAYNQKSCDALKIMKKYEDAIEIKRCNNDNQFFYQESE